jgi:hypothetical protein
MYHLIKKEVTNTVRKKEEKNNAHLINTGGKHKSGHTCRFGSITSRTMTRHHSGQGRGKTFPAQKQRCLIRNTTCTQSVKKQATPSECVYVCPVRNTVTVLMSVP